MAAAGGRGRRWLTAAQPSRTRQVSQGRALPLLMLCLKLVVHLETLARRNSGVDKHTRTKRGATEASSWARTRTQGDKSKTKESNAGGLSVI